MSLSSAVFLTASAPAIAQPQEQPNIVVIMVTTSECGWRTPNIDRLAAEGMLITDHYAEASCTAGRAAFITGELPVRTGMTTVGQAGAPIGLPTQAVTIAAALKDIGYTTGQFGKNHLGDENEFFPDPG